jgi:hypothetical protein
MYAAGYSHGMLVAEAVMMIATMGAGTAVKFIKAAKAGRGALTQFFKETPSVVAALKNIGCFVAGTLVLTSEGLLPIEEIQAGQLVWSYDTITGKNILASVSNPFTREVDLLVKIISGTQVIYTTTEHPFYINGEWISARELKIGDPLTAYESRQECNSMYISKSTFANSAFVIDVVERIDTTAQVYNLTVSEKHNYFVSGLRILVHNGICPKWVARNLSDIGDIFNARVANDIEDALPDQITAIDSDLTHIGGDSPFRTDIDINFAGKVWIEVKKGAKIVEWQVKKQLLAAGAEGMDYIFYAGGKLSSRQIDNLVEWGVKRENIIDGDDAGKLIEKLE